MAKASSAARRADSCRLAGAAATARSVWARAPIPASATDSAATRSRAGLLSERRVLQFGWGAWRRREGGHDSAAFRVMPQLLLVRDQKVGINQDQHWKDVASRWRQEPPTRIIWGAAYCT